MVILLLPPSSLLLPFSQYQCVVGEATSGGGRWKGARALGVPFYREVVAIAVGEW